MTKPPISMFDLYTRKANEESIKVESGEYKLKELEGMLKDSYKFFNCSKNVWEVRPFNEDDIIEIETDDVVCFREECGKSVIFYV